MRRFRVTFSADDFGLHPSVDEAILELVEQNVVHAVSVLVSSPYLDIAALKQLVSYQPAIGLHLAFTETKPVDNSLSNEWPWCEENGSFRTHAWSLFGPLCLRKFPVDIVEREWRAQLEKLLDISGRIDFIDSHQNLHLLPQFAPVVRSLMSEYGISRVRVFCDAPRSVNVARCLLRFMGARLYDEEVTLQTYGLFSSGKLDMHRLQKLLLHAKANRDSAVVMVHPGKGLSQAERTTTAPAYSLNWRAEYELLRSSSLAAWCDANAMEVRSLNDSKVMLRLQTQKTA